VPGADTGTHAGDELADQVDGFAGSVATDAE
jgi:hypothetical protein